MQVGYIKKILSNFFTYRVASFMAAFTLLFFVCTLVSFAFPAKSNSWYNINANGTIPIGKLYDEQSLEMKYYSTQSNFIGMTFSVATYKRTLTEGTLTIKMLDESENEIYSTKILCSSIIDNSIINISFPEQKNSKNKQYIVNFYTSGVDANHAITFWANENIVNGAMTIYNGALQNNCMIFSLGYKTNSYLYTFDLFLLFETFGVMTVVAYGRKNKK